MMAGPEGFPFLHETLALLQRAYDELNTDLESTNTRTGVALTVVVAIGSLVVFQEPVATPAQLLALSGPWSCVLLGTAALGLVLVAIGAYSFVAALRISDAPAPYDLDGLQAQSESLYRDELKFYFRQIDAHHAAIKARLLLAKRKARRFNQGVTCAGLGVLTLVLFKVGTHLIAII